MTKGKRKAKAKAKAEAEAQGKAQAQFQLTVPGTDRELKVVGDELAGTDHDERPIAFIQVDHGIWDLTHEHRRPKLDRFADRYAAIRSAEQRDMPPEAIRALPDVDADHPLADMWQQRGESFAKFSRALATARPGKMVDIGAGSAWLAARLSEQGWVGAAVDITIDGGDGLALARHHDAELFLARAEMDALPFASDSLDLAVFNASLHYSGDVIIALREALRVLAPGGMLAVLDSPVFVDPAAGHRSVAEFADRVQRTHGLETADHEGPGFVTEADLEAHQAFAGSPLIRHEIGGATRRRFRRWRGARRAGRETASRPLLIMHKRLR